MEAQRWNSGPFIAWIRKQLRRRQWNDAQLARQLGMPSGTISRWLSGERQPSPRSCDLIADVFAVEPDVVLTLAGHRPATEPLPADDPLATLIALLRRVRLTPDRYYGLEATLQRWLELDRSGSSDFPNGR